MRPERRSGETGAVSTELAVLTPILIGFMLFAVFAGRMAQMEGDVANAAHEAARAATFHNDADTATAAAQAAAAGNVERAGVRCGRLDVTVDTSGLQPGGQVTITVTCHTGFADLALLAVPGQRTFTASAVEVVDTYRAPGGGAP
jgi:Flp pilus assembly protein TadG